MALLVLSSACAPPRLANAPSPQVTTSPAAQVSSEPSVSPTAEASATATATPTHVPLLQITSAVFHTGEVGIGYAPVTLSATGGVAPLSWSISAGALPGGVTASTGGSVAGTPTAAGSFAFTVRVDDSAGHSATVNRSIAVSGHLAVAGVCTPTTPCAVEAGCTNVCGTFGKQSGGVAPFNYAFAPGGYVPAGMGLGGLSLTGTFPTPTVGIAVPPPYKFQVNVTDSLGATGSVVAQFSVFNHITLPNYNNPTSYAAGTPVTIAMPYAPGSPQGTPTAAIVGGSLPNGSTFSVDSSKHYIVIQIPAQPISRLATLYQVTFQLTDTSLCGPAAGQMCAAKGTATFSIF